MAPEGKKMTKASAARVPWAINIIFALLASPEIIGVKPLFDGSFSSQ
jgi:hypothetical protein